MNAPNIRALLESTGAVLVDRMTAGLSAVPSRTYGDLGIRIRGSQIRESRIQRKKAGIADPGIAGIGYPCAAVVERGHSLNNGVISNKRPRTDSNDSGVSSNAPWKKKTRRGGRRHRKNRGAGIPDEEAR